MSAMTSGFDPKRCMTRLNGRDYLEVKWRLLWLRTEQPGAEVRTELMHHADRVAIFRAEVRLPSGGAATGWGSESADDFDDYIEKAETKALGRALAALGFGTQFCEDFTFDEEDGRVVDAPVAGNGRARNTDGPGPRVTKPQLHAIYAIGRERARDEQALREESEERFGRPPEELSRREASRFISTLKGEAPA